MAAPIVEVGRPVMKSFLCSMKELRLDKTLACGQSFRWKECSPGVWIGVLAGRVWKLHQTENEVFYTSYDRSTPLTKTSTVKESKKKNQNKHSEISDKPPVIDLMVESSLTEKNEYDILHDYFQLSVKLQDLYSQWSSQDSNFKEKSEHFEGIRMLRQHPVENLFSFICSSNNHISRISSMVEKLCEHYGDFVTKVDEQPYFSFPSISALAGKGVEEKLRQLGFGYRAKYISQSAQYLMKNGGEELLFKLRESTYEEVKLELMKLVGVGAKVADCVCLMSLDKHGAIPVDTHVWQIAARDYIPKLKVSKSLTDNLYKEIGNHFRKLWGPYAGWAHSVLFTADLKKFKREDQPGNTNESPKKKKRTK